MSREFDKDPTRVSRSCGIPHPTPRLFGKRGWKSLKTKVRLREKRAKKRKEAASL
jgi:hypothetical protein